MNVKCKKTTAFIFSIVTMLSIAQASALEILGGGGNAASKLILDWAGAKPGSKANPVRFSNNVLSHDLASLQSGKVDFAILDTPLSEAELVKMNLLQYPFALSGVSIIVNIPNNMIGALRLDSATLGKIFSGEITSWDDPAINALNPRHELSGKAITIVYSDESSTDYVLFNNYLGQINEKWKAADTGSGKRTWPANAVAADGYSTRIATIKNTPYSISYLPMQYLPQPTLSNIQIKIKDGSFVGLSDTGITAAASKASVEDGQSASLSLLNKGGSTSWPISTFTFIVINKDRVKDEAIAHLMAVIQFGLKFGSLKPMVHNYVTLPDNLTKSVLAKIEPMAATATSGKSSTKVMQESAEVIANRRRAEEELNRQRTEAAKAPSQDEKSKTEERSRLVKQQADDAARDQAIREARAAKHAAEEAIKAANIAKFEAEKLAEKNRLIAKAEKDKADREKAERDRVEKEKAEKEKALQMRNQKDEDPLEAYRRSVQ